MTTEYEKLIRIYKDVRATFEKVSHEVEEALGKTGMALDGAHQLDQDEEGEHTREILDAIERAQDALWAANEDCKWDLGIYDDDDQEVVL